MKLTTVIPAVLNQIRPGATFMSVMGYENNYHEVSDFGIVFHVSYRRAVERALRIVTLHVPQDEIERRARLELMSSFEMTLAAGHNPLATSAHVYEPIVDGNDRLIRGVKWFNGGREVHLWGFLVHKRIISLGEYPEENWGVLRSAKWRLKERAGLNRFRQFKLVEGRFDHIGVEGLTLDQRHLLEELS